MVEKEIHSVTWCHNFFLNISVAFNVLEQILERFQKWRFIVQ